MASFVISLLGLGLFLIGWFQYRKLRASRSWPSTPGRILAGRVESETQRGGEDEADSTSYYPHIEYEYTVGATTYRSHSIRFDRRGYSRPKAAAEALAAYPVGRPVDVFYDPAKPADAVLERKNSGGIVLIVLGAVLVLVALATALAS